MNIPLFESGQHLPGYEVPLLNERAVRAGAGILFFLAIVSFMNAWLVGNFQPTRVFVVTFLLDFTIRLFINPRFAPSLILGQWIVRRQQPEWVGAAQKRFAWAIGFGLALTMLYLVVLNNVIGPINLIVCSICLLLLFFESAFGICIGCQLYELINKEKAQLCPGGACEVESVKGAGVNPVQAAILLVFAGGIVAIAQWVYNAPAQKRSPELPAGSVTPSAPVDPAEAERCQVPDFAKALGHEDMWKLHNHCK